MSISALLHASLMLFLSNTYCHIFREVQLNSCICLFVATMIIKMSINYGNVDVGGDNVSGGKPKNILGPGCSKVSTGGGANHLDCKVSSECLDFITIVL